MSTHNVGWMNELDEFQKAYIEAALWTGVDDPDGPDNDPAVYDLPFERIEEETAREMMLHCDVFRLIVGEPFQEEMLTRPRGKWPVESLAGHDFWLTRNGTGAGFWDGDWEGMNPKYGEEWGETLAWIAHMFGEYELSLDVSSGLIYGYAG